jgi:uncharacterized protein YkwD
MRITPLKPVGPDTRLGIIFKLVILFLIVIVSTIDLSSPLYANTADDIVRLTNEKRVANGRSRLKTDSDLMDAAAERAKELSVVFSHTRPNGKDCFSIFKEYDIPNRAAAENIFESSFSDFSGEQAVQGWMSSTGHRSNILTRDFTHLGVGTFTVDGNHYAVQLFIKKK